MRPLPTASAIARALSCLGSAVLPRTASVGDDAEAGRRKHRISEVAISRGLDAARAEYPEADDFLEALDLPALHGLLGAKVMCEVPLAWDYVTGKGRQLPAGRHREYISRTQTEFVGTADLIAVLEDRVIVPDLKTGWGAEFEMPEDNLQLRTLGLAAADAFDRPMVELAIIHVTDGTRIYNAEFGPLEQGVHAHELRELAGRISGESTQTEVGPQCRWCDAKPACPEFRRMANMLQLPDEAMTELTPETIGKLYTHANMVSAASDEVKRLCKAFVTTYGPAPIGGGKELRLVDQVKDTINGAIALEVLREEFGEQAALKATSTLTKAALKRAAGSEAGMKLALKLIAERGGVKKLTVQMAVPRKIR